MKKHEHAYLRMRNNGHTHPHERARAHWRARTRMRALTHEHSHLRKRKNAQVPSTSPRARQILVESQVVAGGVPSEASVPPFPGGGVLSLSLPVHSRYQVHSNDVCMLACVGVGVRAGVRVRVQVTCAYACGK